MEQIVREKKNHCMRHPYSYSLTTHDRYLFQGQEMDDEVKGEGNSVNYSFRMHDPRLGRWMNCDPLEGKFPSWSPYVFCFNNPLALVDLDGMAPGNPRTIFYEKVGTSCINTISAKDNDVNKFKGLYLIAQIRTENGFTDAPGNNPFNIKQAGDLGTFSNPKTPKAGKVWGKYSTMDLGVEAGVDLMERKYSKAYKALMDDTKTIEDFAAGLNKNNDGNAWGTDTQMMKTIFKGVVADYEKSLNSKVDEVSKKVIAIDEKLKSATRNDKSKLLKEKATLNDTKASLNKDLTLLQEFKKNEGIK